MLSFHYGEGNNNTNPLTDTIFSINKNGVINHEDNLIKGNSVMEQDNLIKGNNTVEQNSYVKGNMKVKGKIEANEIQVKTNIAFPDYVFDSQYDLISVNELSDFIQTNKHLPKIPSADEIKENGLDLVMMNIMLLEKIEELTLYIIDINRRLELINATNR